MKFTGIVRRIDELGRIVVPIEMRRAHVGCVFCDGNKDISTFHGKSVCAKCRRELQKT